MNIIVSGLDKIEMNMAKFDETMPLIASINIKQVIDKLCKKYKVTFTDEELSFYENTITTKPWQRDLIFQYFASYFGGVRELFSVKLKDYCKLIIILKEVMRRNKYCMLHYILTGIVVDTEHYKIPKKLLKRIKESDRYKYLVQTKYATTIDIIEKGDLIISGLTTVLSSVLCLMEYGSEHDGKKINMEAHINLICDEYLRFLGEI